MEGHHFIEALRRLAAPLERLMLASAEEGAQTQVYCATSPAAVSSGYYVNCEVATSSDDSRSEAAARRLWDETLVQLARLENH